jgi:hypothetical protein
MPRLPGISQKDAVRVFQKLVIPRHAPINAITMGAIARDAGLTPQQFRELL